MRQGGARHGTTVGRHLSQPPFQAKKEQPLFGKKSALATAAALATALVLSACGGSDDDSNSGGDASDGDPVAGGTATIMQISEPRSLDPAIVGNAWSTNPLVGNALYGTLLLNDPETSEVKPSMAEDFSTADGGSTFTLKLREGLVFSDGTPLTAEAVKFNWDRIKDPTLGSSSISTALLIDSTTVVDDQTLTVTMASPILNFDQAVLTTSLNWIAKPEALEAGAESFDAAPIGAGPFKMVKWSRQDVLELERNDTFWDAPKPYLDKLNIRTHNDSNQRWNALQSGGVDGILETNSLTLDKAKQQGMGVSLVELQGGQFMTMNNTRAPFDDVRARKAIAMAIDVNAVNDAAYQGKGTVPQTLFRENSPYFEDIKFHETDAAAAQALFDELAAEGKPVKFTFTTYPTAENQAVAQSVQTQLSTFKNVTAEIEVMDFAHGPARMAARDYDVIVTAANFVDPDPQLWLTFHSTSRSNVTGLNDAEIDAALLEGRVADTREKRAAAYKTVQERIAELVPGVWYVRASPSFVANDNLKGVVLYGLGSPLAEEMWVQ